MGFKNLLNFSKKRTVERIAGRRERAADLPVILVTSAAEVEKEIMIQRSHSLSAALMCASSLSESVDLDYYYTSEGSEPSSPSQLSMEVLAPPPRRSSLRHREL